MINIGTIKFPLNSATKTFAILAKRGAGKSYTGAVMAEEFFKNNIPFVVFDPIDVWWGLRLAKNGKDEGLPVVVFGLEHADIQLDRDMGRKMAQAVVRENISCIISTFGMPKAGQRHLITEFSEEILSINNTPRHIFIEEAHEYIPQRVFGPLGKCFNAVSNLVVMGRNRGLGVTLINQRAATVNKDVLTQLDTLIALRSVGPQDRKALAEWVAFHGLQEDKRFEEFLLSLPELPTGEGWVWSPEFLGIFQKIKIRHRETFHPDREKVDKNFVMPSLCQVDVQIFIDRFSASLREKEAKKEGIKISEAVVEKEGTEIITLRNNYESKLMQKDMEIRKLQSVVEQICRLVGSNASQVSVASVNSSNVQMWLEKLGGGGARRILEFLAQKSGMKFTRSQIGLATRLSSKSSSLSTYMSTLRRNRLIKEEGGLAWVNPDL